MITFATNCSPHPEVLLAVKESGFKAVQVTPGFSRPVDIQFDTVTSHVTPFKELGIDVIVHAPVWLNFVRPGKLRNWSLANMSRLIGYCKHLGVTKIVTHAGYRGTDKELKEGVVAPSRQEAMQFLRLSLDSLLPKLREHQVTLCVENSPGTANGMMMPSLTELVDFMQSIAGTEMSQYVKICCDTQHAWANGESILHTDPIFQAAVLKHCAVVHFNGNPGTNLGAHKDRHSQNTLMETTGYGEEFYKSFLKQALGLPESTRPPFIFERGYVATEDLKQATTLLESL